MASWGGSLGPALTFCERRECADCGEPGDIGTGERERISLIDAAKRENRQRRIFRQRLKRRRSQSRRTGMARRREGGSEKDEIGAKRGGALQLVRGMAGRRDDRKSRPLDGELIRAQMNAVRTDFARQRFVAADKE